MAVQFDREDLLHAMQSRDAEIIVLKHDVEMRGILKEEGK